MAETNLILFELKWKFCREKKKEVEPTPKAEPAKPKPAPKAAKKTEKVEIKANKGYGCNLEHYKWTQNTAEIEVSLRLRRFWNLVKD